MVDPVKVVKVLSVELRAGDRDLDSMIASVSCNLSSASTVEGGHRTVFILDESAAAVQVEISVAMRLFRDLQLYAENSSSYADCILSLEVDGVVVGDLEHLLLALNLPQIEGAGDQRTTELLSSR